MNKLNLFLIRHAKTAQKSQTGLDADRNLTIKGICQANMLGYFLSQYLPDDCCFLVSNANRTQQTAAILQNYVTPIKKIDAFNLYLSSAHELFKTIENQSQNNIVLVGHNDGISELATYLSGNEIQLKTAAFIHLEFEFENWKFITKATGNIKYHFRPEVPNLF